MTFLSIIDSSQTSPLFKALYRKKLLGAISRQKKHKLEKQTLKDINKFIRLKKEIDELRHYQVLSINVKHLNTKDFRRRIKKLLKIYKDNHTNHDTGTELAQVFSILTTQAILELKKSPQQAVEIIEFYFKLAEQINFDHKMDNQKNKHLEIMSRKIRNRRI